MSLQFVVTSAHAQHTEPLGENLGTRRYAGQSEYTPRLSRGRLRTVVLHSARVLVQSATAAVKKQLQEDAQLGLIPKHVQSTLNFKPDDRVFANLDELAASDATLPPRATTSKQVMLRAV